MKFGLYALVVVAGLMNPLQAGSTGAINRLVERPFVAGLVSAAGTFTLTLAGSLLLGQLGFGGKAGQVPWWAWGAGAFGSVFLLAQPVAAQKIGAGPFVGLTVTAATVASVLIDNYGWLQFPVHPASVWRIVGAALMIGGVALVALF